MFIIYFIIIAVAASLQILEVPSRFEESQEHRIFLMANEQTTEAVAQERQHVEEQTRLSHTLFRRPDRYCIGEDFCYS